jgi:iron complex transport system ATP-binding protein
VSADPSIRFDGVTFRYGPGEPDVLRDFSLDVPEGSTTAILGPNGAGKTTLLYLILGWRSPRAGRIEVGGHAVGKGTHHETSRRVGLVPQSEHLPFDFSLLEYVLLGRAPHLQPLELPGPGDERLAQKSIREVGLGGLESRPVPSLSGGQRQLAMIARALAQAPRILLLDEPFSHLDLGNAHRVAEIIRRLSADGLTVLFTTHDPNLVVELADRLVLLRDGQVLAEGPTSETLTAARLTQVYGVPIRIAEVDQRRLVFRGP